MTVLTGFRLSAVLFRARRAAFRLERGVQRVPGQAGALHPRRELANAAEDGQLAEALLHRVLDAGRYHPVELLEHPLGFFDRPALDGVGHERGRGARDGAAGPLERDTLDDAALDVDLYREMVPAERVATLRVAVRLGQRAEVPRPLVVIEDHLLVQLSQVGHQPNILLTCPIASTSRSTSSRVL
jgi:hypothetical protein